MADGVKISLLPGASTPSDSDVVSGVQGGTTKKFSFANIYAWLISRLVPEDIGAVPDSRTVNSKALSSDISLTASDVGARPDTWFPTAAQVGARPDTWTPSASDVGAVPVASVGVAGGVPNLDEIGRVPQNQLPPYPTVPAASTSNPQDLGTASPGLSDNYARADHVHNMPSASDVGALAKNGSVYDHDLATAGWYKVFEFTSGGINRSYAMTMLIENGYNSDRFGVLSFYLNHSSAGNLSGSARWLATTFPLTEFRYTVDNTTKTFTLYAYQSQGHLYFRGLAADSRSPVNTYFDNPSLYWKSEAVNEPTAATLVYPPIGYAIQYTSVTVSAGTNQQIISITDARINASFTLARIEWADPSYITAGYTWDTAAGSFTLTGTATAATTANVLLVRRTT